MNAYDMISRLLQDGLDLKVNDTYVVTEWRPRALFAIQRVVNEIWNATYWDWKQEYAYLTLTGGDTALALPADFYRTGPYGKFYVSGSHEIKYLNMKTFDAMAAVGAGVNGTGSAPDFYTFGFSNAVLRRRMARFFPWPPVGTDVYIEVNYERSRPTIADSAVPATSKLDEIPEFMHEDLVYVGALAVLLSGLADQRAIGEISPQFKQTLDRYVADLQSGQEELQQYGEHGVPDLGMW